MAEITIIVGTSALLHRCPDVAQLSSPAHYSDCYSTLFDNVNQASALFPVICLRHDDACEVRFCITFPTGDGQRLSS